jgi:hypothetical protein
MRLFRALRLVLADKRIPKPIRWIGGIAVLPIPGPVDEVVLILLLPVLALYRQPLREAWSEAGASSAGPQDTVDGHTLRGP